MGFPSRKADLMRRLLLCTDLDRTLIPNGAQFESARAKEIFEHVARQEEVTLAYVTGRHRALIEQAIHEYDLPIPDYAIADVGTTIFQVESSGWRRSHDWSELLAADWAQVAVSELSHTLAAIPDLRLQEGEKQGPFKLSYYASLQVDPAQLNPLIEARLGPLGVHVNLIWSIDEATQVRLLDVLPASASKVQAIRFVMRQNGFQLDQTLFAGDSGNDKDVLASDIPSVLVANAETDLKSWALLRNHSSLYVAQGGPLGMNGNYRGGILEGVLHYWPEASQWLSGLNLREEN